MKEPALPFAGRRVCIAIPSYTGTVYITTTRSLITECLQLFLAGCEVSFSERVHDAMVAHGRDILFAQFLADKEATDLVFVDWDVGWKPGLIAEMLQYPVDMVASIYPRKQDDTDFHFKLIEGQTKLYPDAKTGLVEVAGVPGGMMRISRKCAEKMREAYSDKAFSHKDCPNGVGWAVFESIHEGMVFYGEDYSFCERWRRIGGKVWMVPDAQMTHTGEKVYEGNLRDWLTERLEAVR